MHKFEIEIAIKKYHIQKWKLLPSIAEFFVSFNLRMCDNRKVKYPIIFPLSNLGYHELHN